MMFKDNRGNALVMMALTIMLLTGLTGLVVDGGRLFLEKSNMQTALDAAALSAAHMLLKGETEAKEKAMELASLNGITLTPEEIFISEDTVEIKKRTEKQMTFAKVLGFSVVDVYATARAELIKTQILTRHGNVIPVGIEKTQFSLGVSYPLHFQPGGGSNSPQQGNFGFLAVDGRGAANLNENIKNGIEMEITKEGSVLTEPGLNWGPVRSGFQYRIDQDATKSHCQNYQTADSGCKRVAILPVAESYGQVNGRDKVKVVGFAAFWIKEIIRNGSEKGVDGVFIEMVVSGDFEESTLDTPLGLYSVKLTN